VKPLKILAVNSEWFSRKGGISTLNRELCISLATKGHHVACYVPKASDKERESAKEQGVELITALDIPGLNWCCSLCLEPPQKVQPDLIIGHEHVTGSTIHALGEQYYRNAKRVLMIHVAPEEIEWSKRNEGSSAKADEKIKAQIERARMSDLVVAVGSRLFRKFEAPARGANVNTPLRLIYPGCTRRLDEDRRAPLQEMQVFLMGRVEDFELKGVDLAMRAFGVLWNNSDPTHQDCLKLVIRGAEKGKRDELKAKLLRMDTGVPSHCVQVYEYSDDEEDFRSHMRQASVVLMPSRAEGFGLAGLEAIGAGVPVLISANSGLTELLRKKLPSHWESMSLMTDDVASEEIEKRWANSMKEILSDREAANANAEFIRDKLVLELTWSEAVNELEEHFQTVFPQLA
jgi:glycosyltransferase involved in cell wall biosynthesis